MSSYDMIGDLRVGTRFKLSTSPADLIVWSITGQDDEARTTTVVRESNGVRDVVPQGLMVVQQGPSPLDPQYDAHDDEWDRYLDARNKWADDFGPEED